MRWSKLRVVGAGTLSLIGLWGAAAPPDARGEAPAKSAPSVRPAVGANSEETTESNRRERSSDSRRAAVDSALRAALEAEIAGDPTVRARQLEAALHAAPNDSRARGAAGFLRKDNRWVSYDAVIEDARHNKRLAEYRDRRKQSEPTVASQLALADWCRKQRLEPQERAHLTAVLSLDPEHAAARQRLGFTRVGDRWTTADELAAGKSAAQAVAQSLRKNADAFGTLAKQIQNGAVSHEDAVAKLAEFRSPADIPALEAHLSAANEPAASCVVDALASFSSREASLSLVRHALASAWPNVRSAAAAALKQRDPHSYIPAVIGEFESPWASQVELFQGGDGRIVVRHSLYCEGAEKRQLAVHDHALLPVGFVPDAFNQSARQIALDTLAKQGAKQANDRRVAEKNAQLASLLRSVTEQPLGDDGADWWRWWNDQNECYVEGSKPLEQVYSATSSYVVGVPPPTGQITVGGGGGQTRHECLAAGTLVWTEAGGVAVDRVRPGDVVLAQHPRTGELAFKPVLRTTIRAPQNLLAIHSGGQKIRATGGHPFWVAGKGWTLARHLEPGDLLHGLNGAHAIESIEEESQPVRTFNLVVADFHSYFCGPDKVLSHDNTVRAPSTVVLPGLED